ncbi:MAG: hypothetical protein NWF11_06610 [Candidatus Bathyarchaeota archaeon]|nr:hypothetical protein [Candidatus Bathyarchaeota archaeon]
MRKPTLLMLSVFLMFVSTLFVHSHKAYGNSSDFQIDEADHSIAPIYGGLLLVNDTIKISPSVENALIGEFSIGFPAEYKANLRYSMAYVFGSNENLDVILDTGLGSIGYYGVTVLFPEEIRDQLNGGQSLTFTVVFVFADLFKTSTRLGENATEYVFTADFPLYPSFEKTASKCNVNIVLPSEAEYEPNDFTFNSTLKDEKFILNHTKDNLAELAYNTTRISFSYESKNSFAVFSTEKLSREVTTYSNGQILHSDLFLITSRTAFPIDKLRLSLPSDATDVSSFNEQGKKITITPLDDQADTYDISLGLGANQSRSFLVTYNIGTDHITKLGDQNLQLSLSATDNLRVIPETFTIRLVFPEGAAIKSFPHSEVSLQRDVFQEHLSFSQSNVTWLQNIQWTFVYTYSIFWESFRPTLWTTALVLVGSVVAFAWRRPKAPVAVSVVLVPRKTLTEFYETYEDKKRILSELDELKRKARKGRVSRRRYKIRKTTLENRLATLANRLSELKQNITSGGAKYASMMRGLEVAEIELENIDADIKRIEIRFKRGEVSAQTYRRLLEDDLRRREKARTTIDGVLLRLRE